VTLFNRGKTNPNLFPDLEKLVGDRMGDVSALEGHEFDAVIDTNGYVPKFVENPLSVLKDHIGFYVFVSTCSVYAKMGEMPLDEDSELAQMTDEEEAAATSNRQLVMRYYGALKARCEQKAEAMLPGRVAVVRPGLIVGHGDDTDRFTYWPARVAKGGEVLAPGKPEWETQVTDVRDVADFSALCAMKKIAGIYNVDGLASPIPMGVVLDTCKQVTKSDAKFTWIDDMGFLGEHNVAAWRDLPAWFPPQEGQSQVPAVDCSRAIEKGLTFRPIEQTVKEALAYHESRGADYKPRWTLTPEREAEILAAWKARSKS
jgi:2'-hydroxyisoflavone reductase